MNISFGFGGNECFIERRVSGAHLYFYTVFDFAQQLI